MSNFLTRDQALEYHPLITGPDTPLSEVIAQMIQGYGRYQGAVLSEPQTSSYILIMVEEKLLGIFTERDVVKLTTQEINLETTPVAEVMSKDLISAKLAEFADPLRAIKLFQRHRIRHLPVLNEQEQLVGVVTSHSLRQSLKSTDLLRFRLVGEVMSSQVVTAPATATVMTLAHLMVTHRVSCVVITESVADTNSSGQSPVGILTERDIVKLRNQNLDLETTLAETVMSSPLVCMAPEDSLWDTHQKMQELNVRRLVVSRQGTLAGIVTQTTILSTLNPVDMYNTIQVLQQELNRLRDERMELLQAQKSRLERWVEERTADLSRSNQELEQFAYIVSHDLQEPLRKMKSFSQLLARECQAHFTENETAQRYLDYITDAADRQQKMIQALLEYSRLGRRDSTKVAVDLNTVVGKVLEDLSISITENQAKVTVGQLPTVNASPTQMGQLFLNLIGNGIKFRRGEAPPRIKVEAQWQQSEWLFSVQDNGIGINPRYAERIFQIFQRLHSRSDYPGTGIGLAICRKIVERHGGRIWVASELAQGSTFYFTLPVAID